MVINPRGKLRTVYTPFRVKCVVDNDDIPFNSWVIVEEVKNSGAEIIYCVQGKELSYSLFQIEIKF
jgi:hypothetical protein